MSEIDMIKYDRVIVKSGDFKGCIGKITSVNKATYSIDLDRFTSWGKDLEFEKNEVEAIG